MKTKINITSIHQLYELCRQRKLQSPFSLTPKGEGTFPRTVAVEFDDERRNAPFFEDYTLYVVWGANQDPKPFVVRSNIDGAGAVALVTVPDGGEKILLVRQARIVGYETWEVPRAFSTTWGYGGAPVQFDTLPAQCRGVLAIANAEAGVDSTQVVPTYLGCALENSGTGVGAPAYWWLRVTGYRLEDKPNVKVVTLDEALGIVSDNHSIAALHFYQQHLRNYAR